MFSMLVVRYLAGLLAFRPAAVRGLAARRALAAAWVGLAAGYASFGLTRGLVYGDLSEPGSPPGLFLVLLDSNLLQALAFLGLLYIPALICLSNALAGDGLGFSFSREEYDRHVAVLCPLWGELLLAAALVQLLVPRFVAVGAVEVSSGVAVLALLGTAYSTWALKELNHLPAIAALGALVLSWATLPVFYVMARFLFALPLLLLAPLAYLGVQRLRALLDSGRRERVLAEQLRVLTANPRDADAHYQLGLLHEARGNLATAEGYFAKAAAIDPADPDPHYHLGRVFEERGEWERARAEYEETYRLDPDHGLGDAAREVGKAYVQTGNVEQGLEFLRYFLDRRTSDPEGRYWTAVALGRLGRTEEMRAELAALLETARSNPRFFRKGNRKWLHRARSLLHGSRAAP
jgi:tetratricopeptide (TPR) repeat protein